MDRRYIFAVVFIQIVMKTSCFENCRTADTVSSLTYFYEDLYPKSDKWYNTTFWGGYEQVASKENIGPHCWNRYNRKHFLVLSDSHPSVSELSDTVQSLQACEMSQDGECVANMTLDVMNCEGNLLYRFYDIYSWPQYPSDVYICFDRIYDNTCGSHALSLPASLVDNSVSLVKLDWTNFEPGWYDTEYSGQNYTIPSLKDINSISDRCYSEHIDGLYIQETLPESVGETPVGMRVCSLSNYDYDYYYGDNYYGRYRENCDNHVFIRSCNGNVQFDLSLIFRLGEYVCLVRAEDVKVIPEIRHTVEPVNQEGKQVNYYTPILQYRCTFQMTMGTMYKVKWYVNGTFLKEKGPANKADELVLKEDDLNDSKLGYTVKCGVVAISRKRAISNSLEMSSEEFYAGFKVHDSTVKLTKTGTEMASVDLTVPLGCTYNDAFPANCKESLTLNDLNNDQDTCSDGVIALNANDISTQVQTIKSLKQNEEWSGSARYQFKLMTIDRTYDDKDEYNINLKRNGIQVTDEHTDDLRVEVTNRGYSKDRMCYSHVDPHMRTGNLRTYEQQREGDYMLYRHRKYDIEVLERARFCSNSQNPVCACAVIVRAGADAFMINRCKSPSEIEFIKCGDCGILDVVKTSGSHYEIYTPIGTKISVQLSTWGNGRNMDIDIYLMEKDFDKTEGLCGWFDNIEDNDFLLRNGKTTTNGNDDYTFSENWRLKDHENLFNNRNIHLSKLNLGIKKCHRDKSITVKKCNKVNPSCSGKRKKRATEGKTLNMKTSSHISTDTYRTKRSTVTNITDSEAEQICRNAIYSAPAVLEFPDKLAGEDLEHVKNNCVYDVVNGKDASWAEAHVEALNNIAINILNLNPVYKSNNSETVETFLSHTCLHNCSNNGICSNEGLCNCFGIYRGYDCSIDIRNPPPILDVRDDGMCPGGVCACFVIKTENIFEGFMCDVKAFKMRFNGSREELGNVRRAGEYDDEYTGECCVPTGRGKRSETDIETEPFIYSYDISISNDGINFGEISSVYMYDPTCLYLEEQTGVSVVYLKSGYCFIDDTCVNTTSTHQMGNDSKCLVCEPNKNKYTWTTDDCSKKDSGISTSALIGIIIGSVVVVIIAAFAVMYFVCYKPLKKTRAVAVNNDSINNFDSRKNLESANVKQKKKAYKSNATEAKEKPDFTFDMTTYLPDVKTRDSAKPVFRGKMSNIGQSIFVNEANGNWQKLQTGDYENAMGILNSTQHGQENDINTVDDQTPERSLSAFSLKIV